VGAGETAWTRWESAQSKGAGERELKLTERIDVFNDGGVDQV
jgi:hypothetical protein